MELLKIKNDSGLELKVSTDELENYIVVSGGRSDDPTWDEYLDSFQEQYAPHFILIRESLEKLGWIGETAEVHANDTLFMFSDGIVIGFTWRAWGDLMQAIVGKREGYMKYYM